MPKKDHLGHVQVFWGDGKGKSTSSFGTALRACGNGYNVHLIQFMKNGTGDAEIDYPGEIRALESFNNFSFKRFGTGSWIIGKPKEHHIQAVNEAFSYLLSTLEKEEYDIIIADEVLYAIQLGLLEESKVIELIDKLKQNSIKKDLILTGSHKPFPNIFEKADLVTEIKKIKHPYDKGIMARKGLEY